MKIHFCDICNESVPQIDLDAGRAVVRGGRVVCQTCESSMSTGDGDLPAAGGAPAGVAPAASGDAPAAPAPAARGATGALLAGLIGALALLTSAGLAVVLWERIEQSSREQARWVRTELAREAGDVARAGRAQVDALREERQSADAVTRERLLAAVAAEREQREADRTELAERLAGLESGIAQLAELEAELLRQAGELDGARTALAQLQDDTGLLAERLLELAEAGLAVAPAAAGAAPVDDRPEWLDFLPGLESRNPGTRWNTVQALGETEDPEVVPHLVPMLEDADLYVRMAAARILGDLNSTDAVSALIDALDDVEAPVREAAVVSLRKITGRHFRFDPMGGEAERARRVKAWREWWEDEQSRNA